MREWFESILYKRTGEREREEARECVEFGQFLRRANDKVPAGGRREETYDYRVAYRNFLYT